MKAMPMDKIADTIRRVSPNYQVILNDSEKAEEFLEQYNAVFNNTNSYKNKAVRRRFKNYTPNVFDIIDIENEVELSEEVDIISSEEVNLPLPVSVETTEKAQLFKNKYPQLRVYIDNTFSLPENYNIHATFQDERASAQHHGIIEVKNSDSIELKKIMAPIKEEYIVPLDNPEYDRIARADFRNYEQVEENLKYWAPFIPDGKSREDQIVTSQEEAQYRLDEEIYNLEQDAKNRKDLILEKYIYSYKVNQYSKEQTSKKRASIGEEISFEEVTNPTQTSLFEDINSIFTAKNVSIADLGITQEQWDVLTTDEKENIKSCN